MATSVLFSAKNFKISWNLWCVCTDKGGKGVGD